MTVVVRFRIIVETSGRQITIHFTISGTEYDDIMRQRTKFVGDIKRIMGIEDSRYIVEFD